jgi:hypothetical protein
MAKSEAERTDILKTLENYIVVADFCLPYICCSKKPSINVEFTQKQPVANFTGKFIRPLGDEKTGLTGYQVELENRSQNASKFTWTLLKSNGSPAEASKVTTSLSERVSFDLLFVNGTDFVVELIAERDALQSKASNPFNICENIKDVTVLFNNENQVSWMQNAPPKEFVLQVSPKGGTFSFTKKDGTEAGPLSFTWEGETNVRIGKYQKLAADEYTLTYEFKECKRSAVLTIVVATPVK